MRRVLLYTDEEGNWIAEVPSLPGCGSEGKSRDEPLEQDGLPVFPEYRDEF